MPRKEHKYHYIYKTTCSVTSRWYIGMHSTSDLEDGYIGSGKRLWLSINKHGKESHTKEILEFLESREALKLRERELVNESLLIDPLCMNLQLGGGGGFSGEENQKKWSSAGNRSHNHKLQTDSDYSKVYGIKISNAIKEKHKDPKYSKRLGKSLSIALTGRTLSDTNKKGIGKANSIIQSGSGNSQYGTKWIKKNGIAKKIKVHEINEFIKEGWELGRTDDYKAKIKKF